MYVNHSEFNFHWHLRGNEDLVFGSDAQMSHFCLASAREGAIDCIKASSLTRKRKIQIIRKVMGAWVDASLMLLYAELDQQETRKENQSKGLQTT